MSRRRSIGGDAGDYPGGTSGLQNRVAAQLPAKVPGLAAVAATGTGVLHCEAWGHADLSAGTPMTPDTVCNWFSMTKLVTATAAMQLAEDGRLDLDAPVGHYYEPFTMTRPPSRRNAATVRHLLSHSSGLANPIPLRWVHLATERGPSRAEFVTRLIRKHRRLRFEPGIKAMYSNVGYLVLGEVIAAASGKSFEDQITDRILRPLGMDHTGFTARAGAQWATPYQLRRSPLGALLPVLLPRKTIGPRAGRFRALRPFYVDGAAYGGLVGSAADAARFLQAHLGDGALDDTRILSSESTRAMRRIMVSGKGIEVGLGWFRRGRNPNAAFMEHLGGGAGFWNCMRIYPDLGIGVVTMGNATSYDHNSIAQALIDPDL